MFLSHARPENLRLCFENLFLVGRLSGLSFLEIFSEVRRTLKVERRLDQNQRHTPLFSFGIGLRLIHKKKEVYLSTSLATEKNLWDLLEVGLQSFGLSLNRAFSIYQVFQLSPLQNQLQGPSLLEKLPSFSQLGEQLEVFFSFLEKKKSVVCQSLSLNYFYDFQDVFIANSEGLWVHDERLNQSLITRAYFVEGEHRYQATDHVGSAHDPAFLGGVDFEDLSDQLFERGQKMLKAPYVKAGDFPVVLSNGFGGVIFHEACGHLLETTCVAKGLSPFQNDLNQIIAHPAVSAVDSGLVEDAHAYGNLLFDDEGVPTQSTTLIEKGVLKNFLADRKGAQEMNLPLTGSGRRQDYTFSPASRMRNTFILPGELTPNDLIESVDQGYYCARLGGGSVTTTGEFNFSVEEAYEIQEGRLGNPVKGALLIGQATDILKNISLCANDLKWSPGFCGSVSGRIYVTVGQPHIKVDRLTIGGH